MEIKDFLLYLSFFICVSIITSCSVLKNRNAISYETILIEEGNEDSYDVEDHEDFFLPNQDGFIYITVGAQLKSFYKNVYSHVFSDYKSFKIAILNDSVKPPLPPKMKLPDCDCYLGIPFSVDSVVVSNFSNDSLENVVGKYCQKNENGKMRLFQNVPYNTRMTVAYCLWKKGYHFFRNDISGEEWLTWETDYNPIRNLKK